MRTELWEMAVLKLIFLFNIFFFILFIYLFILFYFFKDRKNPTRLELEERNKLKIKKVVVSPIHTLALTETGMVYSWGGDSLNPVLGHGEKVLQVKKPKLIEELTQFRIA